MRPPHLPPDSCSLKAHYRLQQLPWVLFTILISALTGLAIALAVVAWFIPQGATVSSVIHGGRVQSSAATQLDPFFVRHVSERTATIYNASEKIGGQFYPKEAHIGDAVFLSSDGWMVFAYEGTLPSNLHRWEIIDSQGVPHTVRTWLRDALTGLVYLKVDGEGYRIMDIHAWRQGIEDLALVSFTNDTFLPVVADTELLDARERPIWESTIRYTVAAPQEETGIVLSQEGALVGFRLSTGELIPSWYIETQLGSLLERGDVVYTGLPYRGTRIQEYIRDDRSERLHGFYVSGSPTQASSSTVGVGDVIVRVDNTLVSPTDLAQQILRADQTLTLTILRDDKELDIMVEKTVVSP